MNLSLKSLGKPKNVIFDLDNTLYSYAECNIKGFQNLAKAFQEMYPAIDLDFEFEYSRARESLKKRLGATAASHDRLLYLIELFHLNELMPKPTHLLTLADAYWSGYFSEMKIFPEMLSLLNICKNSGINLLLVTDLTTTIQLRKLEHLSLEEYFTNIITSEISGGDKVTGKSWELLLQFSDFDDKELTWFIGDSVFDYTDKLRNAKFIQINSEVSLHEFKNSNYLVTPTSQVLVEHLGR